MGRARGTPLVEFDVNVWNAHQPGRLRLQSLGERTGCPRPEVADRKADVVDQAGYGSTQLGQLRRHPRLQALLQQSQVETETKAGQ